MTDATFTFRVDEELKSRFTEAAKARDRTGAQLLRDFMRDFVARQEAAQYDAWFRDQVQQARQSARSGQLIAADVVEQEFSARRARALKKVAGRGK